jgi:hypothetical protein
MGSKHNALTIVMSTIQVVKEEGWQALFTVLPVAPELRIRVSKCGNGKCERAKKFKCTCGCHHANHGRLHKAQLIELDSLISPERETIDNAKRETR